MSFYLDFAHFSLWQKVLQLLRQGSRKFQQLLQVEVAYTTLLGILLWFMQGGPLTIEIYVVSKFGNF